MTKRTYFLGAGFSKALNPNYPTLFELSNAVVTNFLARYPTGAIRQHFDGLPNGFATDIEKLLTYLYSDWPWKSSVDKDLDKALYKVIVYEIAEALESIEMVGISQDLRTFIHFLRTVRLNTVVSLNYDTLIERYRFSESYSQGSIGLSGLEITIEEVFVAERRTSTENPWVVDGPNVKTAPDKQKNFMTAAREWIDRVDFEEFRAAIAEASLKPSDAIDNGAWSWARASYNNCKKVQDAFYPLANNPLPWVAPSFLEAGKRKVKGDFGSTISLHGSLAWVEDANGPTIRLPDGSLEKLPAIVPPVLDKSQHYAADRLQTQWIKAHAAIQHSDEIVIIGFSFPPTDISCQFLFASAVKPGCRIVVINCDPNIRDRYDSIFGKIPSTDVDYRYIGFADSLKRYVNTEILNPKGKL